MTSPSESGYVGAGFGRAVGFAWRSLVRQPARAVLGILGVAAVGALLFDMLLLSNGLVLSMRDLFERQGYDVRVTASDALPGSGPTIPDADAALAAIAGLPSVRSVISVTIEDVRLERTAAAAGPPAAGRSVRGSIVGVGGGPARPWTIVRGADPRAAGEIVVNAVIAEALDADVGGSLTVRASCSREARTPPPVTFRISGIAQFPFEAPDDATAGTTAGNLATACGADGSARQGVSGQAAPGLQADFLLVTSNGDPAAAADAIAAVRPALRTYTNDQLVARLQAGGFTYFQQISAVLTAVTVTFALLLITVLLTVSVNQRLGEIAALRALGFSARRVAADVFCESALLVGLGGLISLPVGLLMARWLDAILKRMPGIPSDLHFFVFEPSALGTHAALLAATALLAAAYPMRVVARLPIAATLRAEVVS